ncbi:hypothetical protein [Methermicoccus shengliensis]|uniref:hypothetical protein n=1 Tax=Methermicoccus shengliensis TaxID=660064 RepID=UPI000694671E|nr:hypothetical protein [Methermicoccus shengliensis]
MKKEVQLTVIGKVFKPNKQKVLALNKCLEEYLKLVNWYLGFNSASKKFLHENSYKKAKQLFNLNKQKNQWWGVYQSDSTRGVTLLPKQSMF